MERVRQERKRRRESDKDTTMRIRYELPEAFAGQMLAARTHDMLRAESLILQAVASITKWKARVSQGLDLNARPAPVLNVFIETPSGTTDHELEALAWSDIKLIQIQSGTKPMVGLMALTWLKRAQLRKCCLRRMTDQACTEEYVCTTARQVKSFGRYPTQVLRLARSCGWKKRKRS